ncbi:MAG: cytochrome c-type biosis protein CcmH [Chloroflexota bacterium]|jgi:cytochrome c-type biogenesis protein CcmH|nr:cytochrome c-type biosis protein CcmH [Chloroflexota bacterium]
MAIRTLALALAALMLLALPAVAETTDDQARKIAQELQCPVCQGLSVADSPSELATQMRGVIREKVAAGDSHDEIIQYFVDRYGENILEAPPRNGFTITAWVTPYLALLATLGFLIWKVRQRGRGPAEAEAADPVEDRYLAEVDRAFERVRDEPLR